MIHVCLSPAVSPAGEKLDPEARWLTLDLFLSHHIDVDPASCDLSLRHALIAVWIKAVHPIRPL